MRKNMMLLSLFVLLSARSVELFADEKITINVEAFKVNKAHVKRAAYKALLLKKWIIKKSGDTEIISNYGEYDTRIDWGKFPVIEISYVDMEEDEDYPPDYLYVLRKNILMTLVDCGNP